MTLYHVNWCPECAVVRDKLVALGIPYDDVLVADFRPFRKDVYEVSGQYYVPVLKDGDTVLTETKDILAYLDQRYGAGGARHEARGDGEDAPSCRL